MSFYEALKGPRRRICSQSARFAPVATSFVAGFGLLLILIFLNLYFSVNLFSLRSASKLIQAANSSTASTSAAASKLLHGTTEASFGFEQVVPVFPDSENITFPQLAEQVLQLERAGKGRNIISMSLYGQDPKYTLGAVINAVLVMRDWPTWTLRVYCGTGVPANILSLLRAAGAEIVHINTHQKGTAGMFWRFFPLEDRTVTRVIFRDADAKLSNRDKVAVDEWVASGRYVHAMHDHMSHHDAPLMGGMWGAVNGFVNVKILQAWRDQDSHVRQAYKYGADQEWLAQTLWPHAKAYAVQHASMYCTTYGAAEVRPFPTRRVSMTDFVGNRYWADTNYEGMEWKGAGFGKECPKECRKDPSWTTC